MGGAHTCAEVDDRCIRSCSELVEQSTGGFLGVADNQDTLVLGQLVEGEVLDFFEAPFLKTALIDDFRPIEITEELTLIVNNFGLSGERQDSLGRVNFPQQWLGSGTKDNRGVAESRKEINSVVKKVNRLNRKRLDLVENND